MITINILKYLHVTPVDPLVAAEAVPVVAVLGEDGEDLPGGAVHQLDRLALRVGDEAAISVPNLDAVTLDVVNPNGASAFDRLGLTRHLVGRRVVHVLGVDVLAAAEVVEVLVAELNFTEDLPRRPALQRADGVVLVQDNAAAVAGEEEGAGHGNLDLTADFLAVRLSFDVAEADELVAANAVVSDAADGRGAEDLPARLLRQGAHGRRPLVVVNRGRGAVADGDGAGVWRDGWLRVRRLFCLLDGRGDHGVVGADVLAAAEVVVRVAANLDGAEVLPLRARAQDAAAAGAGVVEDVGVALDDGQDAVGLARLRLVGSLLLLRRSRRGYLYEGLADVLAAAKVVVRLATDCDGAERLPAGAHREDTAGAGTGVREDVSLRAGDGDHAALVVLDNGGLVGCGRVNLWRLHDLHGVLGNVLAAAEVVVGLVANRHGAECLPAGADCEGATVAGAVGRVDVRLGRGDCDGALRRAGDDEFLRRRGGAWLARLGGRCPRNGLDVLGVHVLAVPDVEVLGTPDVERTEVGVLGAAVEHFTITDPGLVEDMRAVLRGHGQGPGLARFGPGLRLTFHLVARLVGAWRGGRGSAGGEGGGEGKLVHAPLTQAEVETLVAANHGRPLNRDGFAGLQGPRWVAGATVDGHGLRDSLGAAGDSHNGTVDVLRDVGTTRPGLGLVVVAGRRCVGLHLVVAQNGWREGNRGRHGGGQLNVLLLHNPSTPCIHLAGDPHDGATVT